MKSTVRHPSPLYGNKQLHTTNTNPSSHKLQLCPNPPHSCRISGNTPQLTQPILPFPFPRCCDSENRQKYSDFLNANWHLNLDLYPSQQDPLPLSTFQYLTLCTFYPDFPQDLQLILAGIQIGEKARPSSLWDLTDLGRYLDCSPKAKWYNTHSGKNLVFGLKG